MKKVLVLFVLVVIFVAWNAWQARRRYRGFSGSVVVTIDPGTHAFEVAALLVSRGVIAHRIPFLFVYGLGRTARRTLKAGPYLFDRPVTPVEVYEKIEKGQVYTHEVVIPEGSDRFDMARILQQKLGMDPETFLRTTEETSLIRDLDASDPTLEGYLFPDTYRFPHGASAAQVVEAMVARFRQVLRTKFHNLPEPGSPDLHEAVTLASLVEKETPDSAERAEIAGVFARRLKKGMMLDCDPTVLYAARLAQGFASLPEPPITRAQLDSASPYNTYRQAGLPPGPICSPGEASIRAAIEPGNGDALYFVSNRHGGHVFASTLAEHSRNVARYREEGSHETPQNDTSSSSETSEAEPIKAQRNHRGASSQQKGTHSRVSSHARSHPRRAHGDKVDSNGASPEAR